MKILFFTPTLSLTGSEVALYNIICNANGQGAEMAVAVGAEGDLVARLPAGMPRANYNAVTPTAVPSLIAKVKRSLFPGEEPAPKEWLVGFKEKYPGYIWYLNTICQPRILTQARKFGIDCVVHSHELEQMLVGLEVEDIKNLVEYPKLIITTSSAAADVLRQLGRKDNLEVVHPPVELKNIVSTPEKAQAVREKLGIGRDTFVWVMSGTIDPNKNPPVFLDLANEMRRRKLDTHFIWIGTADNGYRLFVEGRAEALKLGDLVSWVGIRGDDYYDYLNAADGFVLPSSVESFSIVSVEAAYLGKPIVSFDSRGVREIVTPQMGVIVESRNPSDMVAAMLKVMNGEAGFDPVVSRAEAAKFDAPLQARRWQEVMSSYFNA